MVIFCLRVRVRCLRKQPADLHEVGHFEGIKNVRADLIRFQMKIL